MDMKYKKGDIVVYGSDGLCRITQVKKMSFSKTEPLQNYYVLAPLQSDSSTYYVPADNEKTLSKLRSPLTKQQTEEMLVCAREIKIQWYENRQIRNEYFHRMLCMGVSAELVSLVRCIQLRKEMLSQKGKKLSATDELVFSTAKKMLDEEFSYSLGIEKEKIAEYINSFMAEKE